MISTTHALLIIAVVALCTQLTRWLPFFAFRDPDHLPRSIAYLGAYLPPAIMAILVIYCLKDSSFASLGGWLPQAVGVALTAALRLWRRNTLLSIGVGTAVYMLLLRLF